ncbi:unnamed protein product [Caretta caretta]
MLCGRRGAEPDGGQELRMRSEVRQVDLSRDGYLASVEREWLELSNDKPSGQRGGNKSYDGIAMQSSLPKKTLRLMVSAVRL